MPIPLILGAVLSKLAESGLNTLAGAIQAKGKEVIEDKLGIKIPDEASQLTPELLQALKIKEMEHEEFLTNAALEETKVFIEDRKDARGRDVEYIKAGRNNTRGDVLAYGAIGALVLCIFLLFFTDVPPQSRDLLLVTLGALVTIVKDVYGFEFGSSKDSARNSQAIVDTLKNAGS